MTCLSLVWPRNLRGSRPSAATGGEKSHPAPFFPAVAELQSSKTVTNWALFPPVSLRLLLPRRLLGQGIEKGLCFDFEGSLGFCEHFFGQRPRAIGIAE